MSQKDLTLTFTSNELTVIFDALEEWRLCEDDEEVAELINDIQDKIFKAEQEQESE